MHKKTLLAISLIIFISVAHSQEIQSRITVVANKISTATDKKIFQTLQTSLTNFVNNRKWTNDAFQQNEKINCNFLITLDKDDGDHVYEASLTVQSARPVYSST